MLCRAVLQAELEQEVGLAGPGGWVHPAGMEAPGMPRYRLNPKPLGWVRAHWNEGGNTQSEQAVGPSPYPPSPLDRSVCAYRQLNPARPSAGQRPEAGSRSSSSPGCCPCSEMWAQELNCGTGLVCSDNQRFCVPLPKAETTAQMPIRAVGPTHPAGGKGPSGGFHRAGGNRESWLSSAHSVLAQRCGGEAALGWGSREGLQREGSTEAAAPPVLPTLWLLGRHRNHLCAELGSFVWAVQD